MRLLLVCACLIGCPKPAPVPPPAPVEEAVQGPTASEALDAVFAEMWEARLDNDPIMAAYEGEKRNYGSWSPWGKEAEVANIHRELAALQRMQALDQAALFPADTLVSVKRFMGRGRDDVAKKCPS